MEAQLFPLHTFNNNILWGIGFLRKKSPWRQHVHLDYRFLKQPFRNELGATTNRAPSEAPNFNDCLNNGLLVMWLRRIANVRSLLSSAFLSKLRAQQRPVEGNQHATRRSIGRIFSIQRENESDNSALKEQKVFSF